MTRRVYLASALAFCAAAHAADHKEAPLIGEDPTADIADVYAFVSPENPDSIVLAMTVNGFSVPSEAIAFNFSPNVRYRFEIDTNADGVSDRTVAVRVNGGTYTVDLPGKLNDFSGAVTAPTEEPIANDAIITDNGNGVRAFAGPRDDPFFFDVAGFFRFLSGTGGFSGTDGFAGFNVSAIVLEIPLMTLTGGNPEFAVWGATDRRQITLRRGDRGQLERTLGPWRQIERMGNPAINTALIPSARKDFYNIGEPANDATGFGADIVASLQSLGTNQENIDILASVALPDTLKVNASVPSAYPNGRAPSDDVIDTLFFFIFNQPTTPVTDSVDANDVPFSAAFPYLASPQQAP